MKKLLCGWQECPNCSKVLRFLNGVGYDIFAFGVRIFMAMIFLKSGWLKFSNYLDDNWNATVQLFEYVHPVPGIPAEIAAVLGTGGELVLGVLFLVGLFGRVVALGLLVMTLVIQLSLPAEVHEYWAIIFAFLLFAGLGRFTLDHLLCTRCYKASD